MFRLLLLALVALSATGCAARKPAQLGSAALLFDSVPVSVRPETFAQRRTLGITRPHAPAKTVYVRQVIIDRQGRGQGYFNPDFYSRRSIIVREGLHKP